MFELILTNDDGIDAPGLSCLHESVRAIGNCTVVAPAEPCSGCGHALSTHGPLVVSERSSRVISVGGTPADCVRVALLREAVPAAWVLSGINAGGNLGCDLFHSGTVAAAREAALHGRPAIAFSHYIHRGRPIDWGRAGRWALRVFEHLQTRTLPPRAFWNVNFPHPDPDAPEPLIADCPVDYSPLPLDYRTDGPIWTYSGNYSQRARRPGGDIDTCFSGAISVSLIAVGG